MFICQDNRELDAEREEVSSHGTAVREDSGGASHEEVAVATGGDNVTASAAFSQSRPVLHCGEHHGKRMEIDKLPGKEGAVVVRMSCHKLNSIDPVGESFFADVTIHMYWWEAGLVDESRSLTQDVVELDEARWKEDTKVRGTSESVPGAHVPVFFFENANALEQVRTPLVELRKNYPAGVVHYESRLRARFSEIFELQLFPYDVQTVTIRVRINSQYDKARKRYFAYASPEDKFVKDQIVKCKESLELSEWIMYEPASDLGFDSKGKPQFCAHLVLRRQHGFYTWNVIAMNGATCTLAFSAFALPPTELSDRAGIVLTLLLTTVAFKFAFAASLPKVPYFTVIDIYVYCGFGLMWIIMAEFMIVAGLGSGRTGYKVGEDDLDDADKAFGWVMVSIWVLSHIIFVVKVRLYLSNIAEELGDPIKVKRHKISERVHRHRRGSVVVTGQVRRFGARA